MKKIFIAFACLCYSVKAISQSGDASKFAGLITGPELQKHLAILAGAEMEGRETGTEGQRKAAAYIESQFETAGLKMAAGLKTYQQFYPLYRDSLESNELIINGDTAHFGSDYIITGTNATGSFKSNEVVFAGYGIEDKNYNDYASINVRNKVVVIMPGEPKKDGKFLVNNTAASSSWTFPGLSKKLALAASKGAAGVLLINPMQEYFTTGAIEKALKSNLYYPKNDSITRADYALISHAFAKKILGNQADSIISVAKTAGVFSKKMQLQKKMTISFRFEKQRDTINASNVIGIIEGTDKKEEYVFLTAHYDHLGVHDGKIYFGADDDGSGSVAVIEMANAFAAAKAAGKGPRRTIVFMTVSGEEKGLWGSKFYSDNPVYPLDKTTADLNTDMIGRVDTERKTGDTLNYIYVVGHDKISSELPVINETANTRSTHLNFDYKFDDPKDPERIYYRSDHYNFARKGVPVLFFYDGMLKADYHKPSDTVDKINWELYAKRAQMIFYTAWEIANRDELLKKR